MPEATTTAASNLPLEAVPVDLNIFQFTAKFMQEGGIFMWVILAIWIFGLAFCIERWRAYRKYDIDGVSLFAEIKKLVLGQQLGDAIQLCSQSIAFLAFVLKNGLKRAGQPKDQVQDALEASILEVIPKIEKRLPVVALMANISTLFGLLGTIQGLIASFAAVAGADAAEKAQLLAMGISTAMNTTALGLISAITLMLMHAYLASKAEKMIKEIEENSVKLIDLLGAKKAFGNNDKVA